MSQPGCSRRLSVAPLAGVERQGRGSLGSGGLAVGISHSLPSDTHLIQGTHPFSSVQSRFHPGQGLGGGGPFSVGEGSHRAGSTPISRVLQPVICCDEGLRVVEAGNRPLATEPGDSEDFLQDGDTPVGFAFSTSWRLDGVSRLEGRVLASSDASGFSQVSQVRGLWEDLPVRSGREAPDAVSPVSSQAILGSDRPVDSRSVDFGDPSRSGVVARSLSIGARHFA